MLGTVIINVSKSLCLLKKSVLPPLQARKTVVKCKHTDVNVNCTLKDKIKEFLFLFSKSRDEDSVTMI